MQNFDNIGYAICVNDENSIYVAGGIGIGTHPSNLQFMLANADYTTQANADGILLRLTTGCQVFFLRNFYFLGMIFLHN